MSGYGAFEEEMNSGVTAFAAAMRAEYARPLDPRLEADLVRRVSAQARVTSHAAPKRALRSRSRLVLPFRLAATAGALVVAMAGLAVAGVKLPGPLDSAFETAGVNLPNQAADDAATKSAEPGSAPAGNTAPGSDNGNHKAKGHAKSHGKGKAKGHAKQPGTPNGNAYGQDGGAPGNSDNAPGQTKSSSDPPRATGKAYGHSKPAQSLGSRGKGHTK